jgi:hypothetical protein
MEKSKFLSLPGLEFLSLGRKARSQSLYRLSYHGRDVAHYNEGKVLVTKSVVSGRYSLFGDPSFELPN